MQTVLFCFSSVFKYILKYVNTPALKKTQQLHLPLIEEDKLIALTQLSLLVEHSFISSCFNSKKMDTNCFYLFLECI